MDGEGVGVAVGVEMEGSNMQQLAGGEEPAAGFAKSNGMVAGEDDDDDDGYGQYE